MDYSWKKYENDIYQTSLFLAYSQEVLFEEEVLKQR